MRSRRDFGADVADIRSLLAGPDPQADPDTAMQARLAATRQAVMAQPRPPAGRRSWWPGRPQRRHRRLVIGAVAVPALLAASAAGWAIAVSPPASYVTNAVECYAGHHHGGASSMLLFSDGTPPTALCARYWRTGRYFGDTHSHVVPPLVACVLPPPANPGAAAVFGTVGVFPDTTCAQQHLAELPPGYAAAARRLYQLDRYLQAGDIRPCLSQPAADRFAARALHRFGYQGWTVTHPWGTQPKGFSAHSCWAGQADGAVHAVQVLPRP